MKLINYEHEYGYLQKNKKHPKHTEEIFANNPSLNKQLTRKYGELPYNPIINAQKHLSVILDLLGDIKGKNILDIGCGAKNSWDYNLTGNIALNERSYDPWLCRIARELGAMITGLDGGNSPDEEYLHIQANLLKFEEVIKRFPDKSIDLACAWSFFDSPSLFDGRSMFGRMVEGLERKVKPEGFFVFEAVSTGVLDKEDWERYLIKRGNKQ